MQRKLQYLIFSSFILCLTKISYASTPMLYFVDKTTDTLNVCTIHEHKHLTNCKPIYKIPHISSVAVSPDGHNVFISTGNDKIYGCIRDDEGKLLPNCKEQTSTFNNPKGMAFDGTHYLYVTNAGSNSISVCDFNHDGEIHGCFMTTRLESQPVSIAISSDDQYAYIALPKAGKIAICAIMSNLSFGDCSYVRSDYFKKPVAVATTPSQSNFYILNGGLGIHNSGISCPIGNHNLSDASNLMCKSTSLYSAIDLSALGKTSSAIDIVPSSNDSMLSFVALTTEINACSINNNEFHCEPTSAKGYYNITSVAYAP